MGEAVDGEEAGEQQQGAQGVPLGVRGGLPQDRAAEGEEGGQGTHEQGERAEQQRLHGVGEVLESTAGRELAAGAHGEVVRAPGRGGAGQGEGEDRCGGRGPEAAREAGRQPVGATVVRGAEQTVAEEGVGQQPVRPQAGAGGRAPRVRAGRVAQRTAPEGDAHTEGHGEHADDGHRQPQPTVREPYTGDGRGAEDSGQQGEYGPGRAGRRSGDGVGMRGRHVVAGHACIHLLGEREHVPVPEARGRPIGDTVRLKPRRDLQGVDGPFTQLTVTVHQRLHGVGCTTPGGGGGLAVGCAGSGGGRRGEVRLLRVG